MDKLAYGALWLFVFTMPWERALQLVPGTNIATKVSGGIALGFFLFNIVVSGRLRRWHGFHTAALLFIVYISILTLATVEGEFSDKYWTFIQLFLMLWMIWELAPDRRRLLGLFSAYVLGASVSALQTIFLYL